MSGSIRWARSRAGCILALVMLALLGLAGCGGGIGGPGETGDTSGVAGVAGAARPRSYGLAALTSFDQLAYVKTAERAGHQSSTDRSDGNNDRGNYLFDAGGEKVLLDLRGPGCLYRMWFTGFDSNANVHVYFDGEASPRIDSRMGDLLSGRAWPFLAPLVANDSTSSGGFVSYLPLPFASSLRITSNENNYYYNFDYHLFDPGTPVSTWTGREDASAADALWRRAGSDPKFDAGNAAIQGSAVIGPGQTQTLADLAGPRSISVIRVRVAGANASLLNALSIRIFWDGEGAPSVDAPLGAFFAMGEYGATSTRSLAAGVQSDGTMYMYFPMPFQAHASVELFNAGGAAANVTYELRHKAFNDSFNGVGYFRTQFNQQGTTTGQDITLLDTDGAGQIVGVVQSMDGPASRRQLEGDERALIDGSRSPSLQGTGTEDFYNGGWYFKNGTFSLPTHGEVFHTNDGASDHVTMYREFIGDAIPFRGHVRLSIEHGDTDYVNFQVNASTLAFYYSQGSSLQLTDELQIGDAASERQHGYAITGQTWQGARSFTFEGEGDHDVVSASGRAHRGSSQFSINVAGANQGILLRRLFDQTVANQAANVYVDGAFVGVWYRAGANGFHRWREDDFAIPASFTSGKSRIQVRIQFVSSVNDWNEFQYQAYSR